MKVYKSRENKYIVYLPYEVIKLLGLKGDDEVDFLRFSDRAFLFAKKEDIINLLMGTKTAVSAGPAPVGQALPKKVEITQDEVRVLKKLDTLRYANRTPANVSKLLNEGEKKVLQGLIGKKVVWLFKPKGSYSISKEVYDKFLMRKAAQNPSAVAKKEVEEEPQKMVVLPMKTANANVEKLETDGYIVLPTEAEASSLSLSVEDSIRSGKVLGIRAFNKKFYIVLRAFFDKNSDKVIKELRSGPKKVDEMVKSTGLKEDGIRAMLYLLSEQGDVSERRKDVFTLI